MTKHWYIYRKDHHLGPFTVMNLRELYLRGSLLGTEQLWREGDPGWRLLKEYDGIRYILGIEDDDLFIKSYQKWVDGVFVPPTKKVVEEFLPPDLPEIPDDSLDEGPPDLPAIPDDGPSDMLPVDITDEVIEEPFIDEVDEADDIEDYSGDYVEEDGEEDGEEDLAEDVEEDQTLLSDDFGDVTSSYKVKTKSRRLKSALIAIVVFVLFISPFAGFYFLNKDHGLSNLPFNAPKYANKEIWQTIHSNKLNCKIKIVMDTGGKKMWLASNFHFPAEVELHFTSLDKKVLSEEPISFRSKLLLENHIAQVKKVVYEKGNRLIPGSYRVTLKGKRVGITAKILNKIYANRWAKYLRVIYDPHLVFYSTTVAFVAHGDPKSFEQKLTDFFHKKKLSKLAPYKSWIQKFKTLSYTLGQLKVMIHDHINIYKRKKDLYRFEQDYSSYVGGLIQNIIVEEQKGQSKIDKNSPTYLYQKKFLELAIESSRLGGKVVTALEKRKRRFHKRWKKAFIEYFDERITKLQEKIDRNVSDIAESLSKLK